MQSSFFRRTLVQETSQPLGCHKRLEAKIRIAYQNHYRRITNQGFAMDYELFQDKDFVQMQQFLDGSRARAFALVQRLMPDFHFSNLMPCGEGGTVEVIFRQHDHFYKHRIQLRQTSSKMTSLPQAHACCA